MVLQVIKWNINPDKATAYPKWAENAIKRTITVNVVQFRAYRPITGPSQVAITFEFADLAAWAKWQGDENVRKVMDELRTFAVHINIEVWGPSPIASTPMQYYG
jgi:hypothetical protein